MPVQNGHKSRVRCDREESSRLNRRLDFQMDFQVQFDEPFAHFVLFGSRLSRASLLSLGIPFKDGVFLPFEFGHLLSQHFIPFLNNQEKNSWCRWTLPRVNAKRLLS